MMMLHLRLNKMQTFALVNVPHIPLHGQPVIPSAHDATNIQC
jgi:hypothetical protein